MVARYTIAQFKHRLAVCSAADVVEADGTMRLLRQDVYHCWARIVVSVGSLYGKNGDSIKQSGDTRTHRITVRFRRDIDFTQAAWFYEERLQSGPRWFKLLDMYEAEEAGEYLECNCRLVTRAVATPPVEPGMVVEPPVPFGAMAAPAGVKL